MNTMISTLSSAVDLENPKPEQFSIDDIAYALSNLPRWNGHQRHPSGLQVSIAEHCVRVADLVLSVVTLDPATYGPLGLDLGRAALFHDAHEAITGDISSPVKNALGRPAVEALEMRLDVAIGARFDVLPSFMRDPRVRRADAILLATEARDVMGHTKVYGLDPGIPPLAKRIEPWSQRDARSRFLIMFEALKGC